MPGTNELFFSIVFFASLMGFVVAGILFFVNRNTALAPKLLATNVLLFSITILHNGLCFTSFCLHYPNFWHSTYDGYNSLVPKSCASVGEILKDNGWNTGWWGKMHNVPDWKSSSSGPFDLWPNGLGFEYFYGFLNGDAHQFRPPAF
jgi:hypothetical protein